MCPVRQYNWPNSFLLVLLGIRTVGDVELGAEVSDRGAEIGETAADRDAQPPSAHLHRPHRQREKPRERRARAGPAVRAVRLNGTAASQSPEERREVVWVSTAVDEEDKMNGRTIIVRGKVYKLSVVLDFL